MSAEKVAVEQHKAMIHDWKHELTELRARVAAGAESGDQLQICKQRMVELQSEIDVTQERLEAMQSS